LVYSESVFGENSFGENRLMGSAHSEQRMSATIERPRLSDQVAARRHVVAGEVFVTLHDDRSGRVAKIGEREWAVLLCADGTRDIDGVLAAVAQRGHPSSGSHVRAFIEQLAGAGMLVDGTCQQQQAPSIADRPIEPLAGFRLRCDGSGTCCRIYPTTALSPQEAQRCFDAEPFTPECGSVEVPWRARAVSMVDGRCSFLDDGQRCRLHSEGGAAAKPRGCALFPAQLVDDGRAIRLFPAPECACVFASACDPDAGEPLIPAEVNRGAQLDAATFVAQVPEQIMVRPGVRWSRERFIDWCDAISTEGDVPRLLVALAVALPHAPIATDEPIAAALASEVDSLATALDRRLRLHAYRADDDMALLVPRWMRAALELPLLEDATDTSHAADEAFYLQVLMHGRVLAFDGPADGAADGAVDGALRQRALRLLVARRLVEMAGDHADSALRSPLSLVEAYARGFGL